MSRPLVKEILTDITNRIHVEESKKNGQDTPFVLRKKKVCVLFTGYDEPLDQILLELKKIKRYGYQLTIVLSRDIERNVGIALFQKGVYPQEIITEEHQDQLMDLMEEMDMLLMPTPTQNVAAKLRQGIQDSIESRLLWKALWDGKPVWTDGQNMRLLNGKQSMNPALVKIVEDNIAFLKELGIRLVGDQGYMKEIIAYSSTEMSSGAEPPNQIPKFEGKQVITEKDVLDVVGKVDRISISKDSIVTPLAKDTAKAKKIKLIRT
ncbi:hypothetical protein HNQ80_001233 [Anaerosolibacter carboniphilus]|uniref:Flavoprotein n=1 Tax=Anaerosolibacter carboniphilus TaxID=1417629 RepID=A0A841KMW5_9FIRM|nr:hypothetical protein [Anaerosolibacter carboniphilus]MBB6215144.1 hypothetical protein [Anaerosolibacter carboniphilus]